MDFLALQCAVAAPVVLGLAVFTALDDERTPLHALLAALLGMIFLWLVGMAMAGVGGDGWLRSLGLAIRVPPTLLMAPLFLLASARLARIRIFEEQPAASVAVMVPFAAYYVAYLTNSSHGLISDPAVRPDLLAANPQDWAGPVWWAFQVCSNAASLTGIAICAHIAATANTRAERRRAGLLIAGVLAPLLTHVVYVFQLVPMPVPLTPSALVLTGLFVAAAIQRYQLLEVRPLARRDVIEALRDGVLLADTDGTTVDANPAAAEILDVDRDALRGRAIASVIGAIASTPEERERLVQQAEDQRNGRPTRDQLLRTTGGRWLEISTGSTGRWRSQNAGMFVVIRDRTRERATEQQLQQSQRLESVGVLAAGVAHEVNNPLAFVRSNLEYMGGALETLKLRLDEIPAELRDELVECQEVVAESSAGIERIGAIVAGLLRFSRASDDERSSADLNALVEEALRLASLQGKRDQIEVSARLAEGLPLVDASAGRLVQVLLNLLLNAKQALRNGGGGTIEVETSRRDGWVEACVRDDGPGIPPEIVDRIFDPFFTTREPGEGTGLGLSIAYDIVQEHSGELAVDSEPGGGACFTLRLPISADAL